MYIFSVVDKLDNYNEIFFFLMNERGAGATICGLSPIT